MCTKGTVQLASFQTLPPRPGLCAVLGNGPLLRLSQLLVAILGEGHGRRGDIGAEHRRVHIVPAAEARNISRHTTNCNYGRVHYLKTSWSPTLCVRVTLMPLWATGWAARVKNS